MNKLLKISLIFVSIIASLILIVALIISPVAKWYIEKNSQELVGRVLTMDRLSVNIFTGSLRIVNFELKEQDEKNNFVQFDTLAVNVRLPDLLRNKVTVRKAHLTNFKINIWQDGSEFNFDDIINKFASTDTVETTPSPWEVGIFDIQLRNGSIHYEDLAIGSILDIENFTVNIPGIYFAGGATDIDLQLNFTNGGSLASRLRYNIESSQFNLHVNLESFPLESVLPYVQQFAHVNNLDGLLKTYLDISGDLNHIANLHLNGKLAINDLNLIDEQSELILSADSILVDINSINLQNSIFSLNEITTKGLTTRFIMHEDSTNNFSRLMIESEIEPEEIPADTVETKPIQLNIAKINITGTNIHIKDSTLQVPFSYELRDFSLIAADFNPNSTNVINIEGGIGSTGQANIHWDGNFNDLSNLTLNLNLQNVSLSELTPYSLEFTAFPITGGMMNLSSTNVIRNNMLRGANELNMYRVDVDRAREDITPVMRIPLRMAISILRDRNNQININLPVEGDINSPVFSYRRIILQTLTNLLVRAVTAPFDILARTMGFNAEDLERIAVEASQSELTTQQLYRLSQLAQVIEERPELQLIMQQQINYQTYIEEFALQLMPDEEEKEGEEMTKEERITRAVELHAEQAKEQILALVAKRNQLVEEYLLRMNVPRENLQVETILTTDDNFTGYKVSLNMP